MWQNSSNAVPTLYFAKSGFQGYSCQHLIRRPTPFEVRFRIIGRHLGCGTSRVYKKCISFSHGELFSKLFWSDFAKDILILCLYLNYFTRFVISTKLKTMISGCGEHDICYFVSNRWTPTCFYNFQAMAPNQKFNI